MKHLHEFIRKNGYELGKVLEYNSYRTWERSETRDFDSLSVTELLKLIIDPNMNIINSIHSDKMQKAMYYGTQIHKELETYFYTWELPNEPIHLNFRKALIQKDINILEAEKDYELDIGIWMTFTAKLDTIVSIDSLTGPMDYKTSRKDRNFISMKYELQWQLYAYLAWYDHSWTLYLNNKNYKLVKNPDNHLVILELIEYARSLHEQWSINNLYLNTDT